MQKIMRFIYEFIMLLMIIITIITLWTENTYDTTINWIIWAVFTIDFFTRFFKYKQKWSFIKGNPFLLIAIIPFDQFFQISRIVRIIYLFRIKTIAKYYISPYVTKMSYQSKSLVASLLIVFLLAVSAVIWSLENSIVTYYDALYATFGHLLFFGRHIFTIESTISIWILTGTTIIGIVVQGLALQWILTKLDPFIMNFKKRGAEN